MARKPACDNHFCVHCKASSQELSIEKKGERVFNNASDVPIIGKLPKRLKSRVAHSQVGKIAYWVTPQHDE